MNNYNTFSYSYFKHKNVGKFLNLECFVSSIASEILRVPLLIL